MSFRQNIYKSLVKVEKKVKKMLKTFLKVDGSIDKAPVYKGAVIADFSLVNIGERVSFGGQVMISNTALVTIGHDCMIAYGVHIITATHDYNNHPMWKHRIDRPVQIGNHVWIGTNAIILPGVKIGDYAVIGAGTVVASHVPEKAVVVGNPARIVKYRDLSEYDETSVYPGEIKKRNFQPENKITKEKGS